MCDQQDGKTKVFFFFFGICSDLESIITVTFNQARTPSSQAPKREDGDEYESKAKEQLWVLDRQLPPGEVTVGENIQQQAGVYLGRSSQPRRAGTNYENMITMD